jgi:transposase InsO family protein
LEQGVDKIAELIRCSARSVRDWIRKWRRGGDAALEERCRRPKRVHWLERERIEQILDIRERHGYGCSKISFDVRCSSSTVHKYLKVHNLNRQSAGRRRFRCFERKHANTLWQMDYTMLRENVWVLQVVDDHSRFIVGAKVMISPDGDETIQLLKECFSRYGVPEQFLTDHGRQFCMVKGGDSAFDRFCLDGMVQHILASIAHPRTLGKTEQRHNMMKNYLARSDVDLAFASRSEIAEAVDDWVGHHNFDSPHECWTVYRLGDLVKKKRDHFLPFMRFANHRK